MKADFFSRLIRPTFRFLALFAILGMAFSSCARAQNTPSNVLRNADFSQVENGVPVGWTKFEGGFDFAVGQGRNGGNALVMQRDENDKARGASQVIVLEQTAPSRVTLSGWSRAENISGQADNDYALFADVLYADGSNDWGINAPFQTGTHDWQRAELVFTPKKPIKSLTFYAMLRNHTGKAWFSDLQVSAAPRALPSLPMAPVEAVKTFAVRPYVAAPDAGLAAWKIAAAPLVNRLQNGSFEAGENGFPPGWQPWEKGATLAAGAGRDGSTALFCESAEAGLQRGAQQQLVLNQARPEPVAVEGWSRAENVSGAADSNYSLYCDVLYTDGTTLWGVTSNFVIGTHDWQRAQVTVTPDKPIKMLTVYALFRDHTGKVWFDDFAASTRNLKKDATFFDGVPLQLASETSLESGATVSTKDGLSLNYDAKSARVSSLKIGGRDVAAARGGGFLARDVANDSGYYGFQNGASAPLKLKLESKVEAKENCLVVSGHVEDTAQRDRAISLIFALPLDARGWTWDDDVRAGQSIENGSEYSRTENIGSGSNGKASIYPLANLHDAKSGVALALDMNFPAQYRLSYNADAQQLFIAYDFGLTAEKPRADFRFVIYQTDAQSGFRDALAKLYRVFPSYFALRNGNRKQGLWMPFLDISKVEKPEDFGFRFREAGAESLQDGSAAWDDAHDVLTLLYSEPMTYWMPMPLDMPRTYDAALDELRRLAADEKNPQRDSARAVISSGMRDAQGRLAARFENQPWANGAVWSLNPTPGLNALASTRNEPTGASLVWNAAKLARLKTSTGAKPDGEYLDSVEGYATADLNYARDQFAASETPLTFDTASFAPVQNKGLLVDEMTRWMSREVRGAGGLMMANGVPYRFGFLAPWLDVMGTETNWKPDGKYAPESDAAMNLRRALSGPKPYLLLQNTDFNTFTHDDARHYMERCLFYGVFPSFFSANAATDIYWANPKFYNRDRDLFVKYVPLVRAVAEAGWQPLTRATSENKSIWIERFGDADAIYLTLRNDASTRVTARVTLEKPLNAKSATDVSSDEKLALQNGAFEIALQPDETRVVKLR